MKKEVFKIVKEVITENPKLRNDDFKLVAYIYTKYYGVGSLALNEVLENHKQYALPSMASIVRARRKAQVEDESLRASAEIEEVRSEEEILYKTLKLPNFI